MTKPSQRAMEIADDLFDLIAHGDSAHRQWLLDTLRAEIPAVIARHLPDPSPAPSGDVGELVERLQHCHQNTRDEYLHELTGRAAATITDLTARLAQVEGALNNIADAAGPLEKVAGMMRDIARTALKEIDHGK